MDCTFSWCSLGSTMFWYSPGFYDVSVLAQILPFSGTHWFYPFSVLARTIFRYSHGFYLFLVLAWILRCFGTRPDLPFFNTHTNFILFRYSPGQFFNTRKDSTIFRYSHWFYPFPVLAQIVFRCSHGFYVFLLLAQILPISGTITNSTLFRNSSGKFFNSSTDSTFSRFCPDSTIF